MTNKPIFIAITEMLKQNHQDERKQLLTQFSAHLTLLAYQIFHQKMTYQEAYQHVMKVSRPFQYQTEKISHV
ncbi:MAG: hypothetical protein ACL7BU_16505 [Candidatus Phlomobacter fragariae]